MRKTTNTIKHILLLVLICALLFTINKVYKKYYYGEFIKAEYNSGISKFTRDDEVRYNNQDSYRIDSTDYNDACFYQEIQVEPNTPYRMTCQVKTENVIAENNSIDSGAQIFIVDTVEHSNVIQNSENWEKLDFKFYSKENTTLKIGFRLGGNEYNCKGTAWFSDFKLEKGINNQDTNWNMACFIFKNVDVYVNAEHINLSMDRQDIETMKENMERFKIASSNLSNNQMTVTYDIFEINTPIKSLTYSEEYGYYVGTNDVKEIISSYLNKEEYDYIFTVVRLGKESQNIEIPTYDWIGLGGMDLEGIGYSNIRLPNSDKNYIYTYDYRINTFPEEVFVHEFLHTLERISEEAGYDRPELHSNKYYGYEDENLVGLKEWYKDYMQCKIIDNDGNYIGLDKNVYRLKPVHSKDFKYSVEIDFAKEPENIIEAIKGIIKKIES